MKYSKIVETWFSELVANEGALVDSLYQCRVDRVRPFLDGRTPGLMFDATTLDKQCLPSYLLASNVEPPEFYYQYPRYLVIDLAPVLVYTEGTEEYQYLTQHQWFKTLASRSYLVGVMGTDSYRSVV